MIPIPWRYMESWNCINCGICCKEYQVVLQLHEWVNVIKNYGVEVTQPSVSKFYLGKKGNGTCIFLTKLHDVRLCGLQTMKPKACKLWPFKILSRPKFGRPNEARYGDRNLFVYSDPACRGIIWGRPSQRFMFRTLPEFVEIALGLREEQCFSTSKKPYSPRYLRIRGRKIV